jgi:hypothetical protein
MEKLKLIIAALLMAALPVVVAAQTGKSKTSNRKKIAAQKPKPKPKPGKGTKMTVAEWGGRGIGLTMDEQTGRYNVEMDCAHGTISQALTLDANGRFDAAGTFTQERPGPVRLDRPDNTKKARYSGKVEGDTMTLEIKADGEKEAIGSFTLKANVRPRIVKCL